MIETLPKKVDIDPFEGVSESTFWFWDRVLGGYASLLHDYIFVLFGVALTLAVVGKKEHIRPAIVMIAVFTAFMASLEWATPVVFALLFGSPGLKKHTLENLTSYWPVLVFMLEEIALTGVLAAVGYGLGWLSARIFRRRRPTAG